MSLYALTPYVAMIRDASGSCSKLLFRHYVIFDWAQTLSDLPLVLKDPQLETIDEGE